MPPEHFRILKRPSKAWPKTRRHLEGPFLRGGSGLGGVCPRCPSVRLHRRSAALCSAQLPSWKAAVVGCTREATPVGIRDCHVRHPCDITAPCFRDSNPPSLRVPKPCGSKVFNESEQGVRGGNSVFATMRTTHCFQSRPQTQRKQVNRPAGRRHPTNFQVALARSSVWTPTSADWLEGAAT